MKKTAVLSIAIWGMTVLGAAEVYACINSNCKPCPLGFSLAQKCCKAADSDDCIFLDEEIEDCGKGLWSEYPNSLPIKTDDFCCEDATETHCKSSGGQERYCGTGETAEFPYSSVKKCCKDAEGDDCVIIRSKKICGKYQLEDYPLMKSDCCNSLIKKCTGHVKDCPKCI